MSNLSYEDVLLTTHEDGFSIPESLDESIKRLEELEQAHLKCAGGVMNEIQEVEGRPGNHRNRLERLRERRATFLRGAAWAAEELQEYKDAAAAAAKPV
jgi:hypothetical protein